MATLNQQVERTPAGEGTYLNSSYDIQTCIGVVLMMTDIL